ncbi:unnamed protein product [Eruca vesicaria subsp. sativa]|uniref:Uncharacterized protein n=1 Tax=Eruca vesicaria subsp. sativa TaxID=29727 RepID=A0ABC8ITT5_ERUVS|nr:unnamed protein product [Eruca vesicaria subsp. sativa]
MHCSFCSAVEHFKEQFAYLEEHYKNGTSHNPPERQQQHASLPRACVLYSDNNHAAAQQSSVEVTDGLSKCSIRDAERPRGSDRNWRVSINVPQTIQGATVARPGKVVGSVLRYNNCGAATGVEALEQQHHRMVRNPASAAQYPKRNSSDLQKQQRR